MTIIAAICWGIWCTHNRVTFENHVVRSPLEAVFTACSLLMYWSGLLKEVDRANFQSGVQRMVWVAASLADRSTSRDWLAMEGYAGA